MSGNDLTHVAWLLAAIVGSILVIALALYLSRPLADAIDRRASSSAITASQTRLLARLLMCGVALVVTQAILRRPVALIVGGDQSLLPVEAGIAAGALAALLLLLVLVYETARPMVQELTLKVIDAAVPTLGTSAQAEPTRTAASATPRLSDAVTVLAPLVLPTRDAISTVTRRRDGDATPAARRADGEATTLPPGQHDVTRQVRGA
jgi:hypothetical protein